MVKQTYLLFQKKTKEIFSVSNLNGKIIENVLNWNLSLSIEYE